jgi:hypothetical protein
MDHPIKAYRLLTNYCGPKLQAALSALLDGLWPGSGSAR